MNSDLNDDRIMSSRTVIAMSSSRRSSSADMHRLDSEACMKDSKQTPHRLSSVCSFLIQAKFRLGSSGAHPLVCLTAPDVDLWPRPSHPTVTLSGRTWRNAPVLIGARQSRASCQSPPRWYVACVQLEKSTDTGGLFVKPKY